MSARGRVGILVGFLSVLTLLLVGRIFQTAVIDHSDFLAKAKDQQQVERDIIPRRGTIYVQDYANSTSVAVAESTERFALSVTPRNVVHKQEVAHLLAAVANTDEDKLKATFDKNALYMEPLLHNLSKDQVTAIADQVRNLEIQVSQQKFAPLALDAAQGNVIQYLDGVLFIREFERAYPEGGLLGPVLGFVNDKGSGQYGFEGQYDSELKGYTGRVSLERDSRGVALTQFQQVDGQDGTSYELTIDRNIQQIAEKYLADEVKDAEAKGGSVTILDPKTGNVLAMASNPTYNPEEFRTVAKTSSDLFDNPVISNIWEPGSIFKPLVMAAALDKGIVTPDTADTFPASVTVNGYEIHTALNKAFGHETMTDVLVNSDNVAMVWLSNKIGNQTMADYFQRYGFGTVTGIDLKNEVAGKVQPVNKWSDVARATMSFGQGIAVTPIQIASAYASIANGGMLVPPRIVKAVIKDDGTRTELTPPAGRSVMKPETAAELKDMLTQVVVHNHKRAGVDGYKIAGKTGTAQVPDLVNGGYITDGYNHSFAGFGPVNDPKFVILIKIDQPNLAKVGQFAESTAVPLFGKMASFLLHYYQIPPTNK